MRKTGLVCLGVFCLLALPHGLEGASQNYMKDFAFIKQTVGAQSAALRKHKIDWRGACKQMEPLFKACQSDADHVKNISRLLAVLKDSHTSITRTSVGRDGLPSKWDGLYGGGLWFAWEDGRIMLRGIMDRHPLAKTLPAGSALVQIEGLPAWLVMARERARIARYSGISSDHSLFSSMGNRFLPFGDKRQLSLDFLTPDLKWQTVKVGPWGPGGKAFYPYTVQFPEGLSYVKGAVSKMLSMPWCDKVGYLRITGSMDTATTAAFHKAFDALKGMEALILDCRSMGGGSDYPAWEMAGRLLSKKVAYGRSRQLTPSGSWQFSGPVVMLQNETEVSSAETFTWAVSETRRVVSVGRPTGGWCIIPRIFKCPSGLVDFRLGVTDRRTPLKGILTEGIGWPPDIQIPYGPVFCGLKDPTRQVGLEILSLLHAGLDQKSAVALYQQLFSGQYKSFQKSAAKIKSKAPRWRFDATMQLAMKDLQATCALELALINHSKLPAPDVLGASKRIKALSEKVKNAGKKTLTSNLDKMLRSSRARAEAAAQEMALKLMSLEPPLLEKAKAAFLKKHGKTRIGQLIQKHGLPTIP